MLWSLHGSKTHSLTPPLEDFLCAGDDRGPGGFLQQQALLKRADGDDTKRHGLCACAFEELIQEARNGVSSVCF